jgi:myo-inositol-1-phosphate synthase
VADIEEFRARTGASRLVMIWCGSTEAHTVVKPEDESIEDFEKALEDDFPEISPSMIYAYASVTAGVPFANAAPNLCVDIPALVEMAKRNNVPIAGKDLKTGQTLMKTIVAPGFKARMLGVRGWYSTNILGNRDGEVLDDPELQDQGGVEARSSPVHTPARPLSRLVWRHQAPSQNRLLPTER